MAADSLVGESVVESGEVLPEQSRHKSRAARRHAGVRRRSGWSSRPRPPSTASRRSSRSRRSDPTAPTNPYGETKLAFERALAWYERAYGLRYASLRYFNAAGASRALRGGARARDAPDSAGAPGGGRAGGRGDDLRRRLSDAPTAPASGTTSTSSTWRVPTCSRWAAWPGRQPRVQSGLRRRRLQRAAR